MQTDTKVSIIINNYNYAEFIGEAIDSVLKQTYTNWELIIVDDGSTDRSRALIMKYAEAHPNKIKAVFKPNGGQGSAFNAGFALAEGSILAFLDSDDYWRPDKLERVVPLHSKYEMIGHNQNGNERFGCPALTDFTFKDKLSHLLREYGFICQYNATTSALSFQKRLLDRVFPISEEVTRICADAYVTMLASYYSNMYYIDEPLGFYRTHEKNHFNGNKAELDRRERTLFEIQRKVNQRLIKDGEIPIPYKNPFLLQQMYEREENFRIAEKEYLIYGTGSVGGRVTDYVTFCGGRVFAYCDSDSEKWGSHLNGMPVLSPEEAAAEREKYEKVIIASTWISDISRKLEELGLKKDEDYIYSEIGFW